MNKLIIAVTVSAPLLLLTGCTVDTASSVDTVVYNPGYSNDYVYSVGYYTNRPYWGNNYYYYNSYTWSDNWEGGYYNGY